jgi:hypothetical protein
MNKNKKIDLSNFDFNDFKAEALTQLKSGQSLTEVDPINETPIPYFLDSVQLLEH